jgi:hypothetical protein
VGSQISPLHFAAGSQIFPLNDAAASQILAPHDAAGSQFGSRESIWQRGVKSKNSGRLPRPLKGPSWKKNHVWEAFNILVLWESCIKTLPTYKLFWLPASNSKNSANLKPHLKKI